MLIKFNVKSAKDKKPTIYVDHLLKHFVDGIGLKDNQFVRVFFTTKSNQNLSYLFKASRAQRGTAFTLFGYEEWFHSIPLPKLKAPIEYNVSHFIVNPGTNESMMYSFNDTPVAKPRPQPFPTDILGHSLVLNASLPNEGKGKKINPLDERVERLLVEVQSSLILAGGTHREKLYNDSFENVMRNLLSNVDKKTLVKIIENAYVF